MVHTERALAPAAGTHGHGHEHRQPRRCRGRRPRPQPSPPPTPPLIGQPTFPRLPGAPTTTAWPPVWQRRPQRAGRGSKAGTISISASRTPSNAPVDPSAGAPWKAPRPAARRSPTGLRWPGPGRQAARPPWREPPPPPSPARRQPLQALGALAKRSPSGAGHRRYRRWPHRSPGDRRAGHGRFHLIHRARADGVEPDPGAGPPDCSPDRVPQAGGPRGRAEPRHPGVRLAEASGPCRPAVHGRRRHRRSSKGWRRPPPPSRARSAPADHDASTAPGNRGPRLRRQRCPSRAGGVDVGQHQPPAMGQRSVAGLAVDEADRARHGQRTGPRSPRPGPTPREGRLSGPGRPPPGLGRSCRGTGPGRHPAPAPPGRRGRRATAWPRAG